MPVCLRSGILVPAPADRTRASRARPRRRRAPALAASALATLVLLGGVAPAQAQAPGNPGQAEALAVLERAAERYRSISAFCADFRQEVQNDLLGQTTRSRGELCQRRPDRFEMRFTDPAGDRVVADGAYLYVYFPSTDPGQAFRTDPGAAEGRFDLHREFLEDAGARYTPTLEGDEAVDGRPARVLALRPTGRSPFLHARIWVDSADSVIRRLEITESEGFVRTLVLSNLVLNPDLPDARFRFEAPAGVRVVTR
jgi:outer membrane lipoprotein carrier protein